MTEIPHSPNPAKKALLPYLTSTWTVIAVLLLGVALLDPDNLITLIRFALRAIAHTGQYILFAVFLLAYLKATGAEVMVARAFQGRETRMIFLAALLGGLAPFCSCEVIPFIAGLLALGTPLSAVMAFWLASPLIDPPTLLITAGALGWDFAIGKAIFAVALGLFGGFVVKSLIHQGAFADPLRLRKSSGCGCCGTPENQSAKWAFWQDKDRRVKFREEFLTNSWFLLKWLSLAYVLEALLISYVPADKIAQLVGGDGILPIVIAAFVGMPAYLNSYVAPPLLAGLIDQGMSNGAAMSFMIAGAVSSIPAMAAVWSLVKPQVFATYLGLGITGAIVSGIVFQMV